jgi:hypothetical protein
MQWVVCVGADLQQLSECLGVGIDGLAGTLSRTRIVHTLGLAFLRLHANAIDEAANILTRLGQREILGEKLQTRLAARCRLVEQQQQAVIRHFQVALAGSTRRSHLLDGLEAGTLRLRGIQRRNLELQPATFGHQRTRRCQHRIHVHHLTRDFLVDHFGLPQNDFADLLARHGDGERRAVTLRTLLATQISQLLIETLPFLHQ